MSADKRLLAALACASLALSGCRRPSDAEAERVVRTYNARLVEAFRTADASLTYGITGWEESRRLTGLVGVKKDMGITLDATLLDLSVVGIARQGDEVVVSTHERWYYRDLAIGSGQQVGEDSRDEYRLRYHLRRQEGRWVVDRKEFAEEPEVGRKQVPNVGGFRQLHGIQTQAPQVPQEAGKR